MPAPEFVDALNEQIAHEFAASQQYVAVAVHYDRETLPRLAGFFYAQAVEERGHAMKMIQYLMDVDADVVVPPVRGPRNGFADIVEPIQIALDQEKQVTEQISRLAKIARETGDYQSEQFIQWFLKEQVEEVSTMGDLLTTVKRSAANPLWVEEFLARESFGGGDEGDAGAPPTAGGDL
ncbi:ferritin [Patulibacter sp.]|uniref:ferritin n=1 Tax=Patulibacter sp. TaxID=1912859 RepID=UPI0027280330|nr:ferritin [Patulibacter sp.]MDO9410171.1 ferritin [Patulibacter sp.]